MERRIAREDLSGAAVERLFSQVGIAFSAKRRSAESDTLADQMFARFNLPEA